MTLRSQRRAAESPVDQHDVAALGPPAGVRRLSLVLGKRHALGQAYQCACCAPESGHAAARIKPSQRLKSLRELAS